MLLCTRSHSKMHIDILHPSTTFHSFCNPFQSYKCQRFGSTLTTTLSRNSPFHGHTKACTWHALVQALLLIYGGHRPALNNNTRQLGTISGLDTNKSKTYIWTMGGRLCRMCLTTAGSRKALSQSIWTCPQNSPRGALKIRYKPCHWQGAPLLVKSQNRRHPIYLFNQGCKGLHDRTN